MGWEHFYTISNAGGRRKHPFLKTLKSWLPLVLIHSWRLASVQR